MGGNWTRHTKSDVRHYEGHLTEFRGELWLCEEVIIRAIRDARAEDRAGESLAAMAVHVAEALNWLTSESEERGAFRWWVRLMGLDADECQRMALEAVRAEEWTRPLLLPGLDHYTDEKIDDGLGQRMGQRPWSEPKKQQAAWPRKPELEREAS